MEPKPVTPVTTSIPCCNSVLNSSVFVPSEIPRRRFTGFSSRLMNTQARPRVSTVGNGAKAYRLLQRDNFAYAFVFDDAQRGLIDFTALGFGARCMQFGGA